MPLLGAHMSISGGYYKAVAAAAELGMDCVQLFTKNNNQWNAKPITPSEIEDFRSTLKQTGLQAPVAHDSYLINLASPKPELWQKSVDAFKHELERAEALGLMGVVMHPGAYVDSTPEEGLARIVAALDEIHAATAGLKTLTLLETTAGQGSTLGAQFAELGWIIQHAKHPERLGVCVDTCHIFAAGYPLIEQADYESTFTQFDTLIGIERIKAFHLNDSLKPLASRVDRHAHIGEGFLGLEPFRHVLNDPRFKTIPMYLETPKGEADGEQLDARNLRTLRSLMAKSI